MKKHLKIIVPILILISILLSLFIFNKIENKDKTATIKILVAPIDATVKIGGVNFATDTTIKIKPGIYNVEITHPELNPFTGTIEAKEDEVTNLYEYLEANSEADNFYSFHPEDASRAQSIADLKAVDFQKSYAAKDPIFNITPYSSYDAGFEIYASTKTFDNSSISDPTTDQIENKNKIYLKIRLISCVEKEIKSLKSDALKYLTDHGIDPNKYIITYVSC